MAWDVASDSRIIIPVPSSADCGPSFYYCEVEFHKLEEMSNNNARKSFFHDFSPVDFLKSSLIPKSAPAPTTTNRYLEAAFL